MKHKKLLYVIPIAILIIAIILYANIPTTEPICGDGICQEREIKEGISLCDIDCKDVCIQATEGIEDVEGECSLGWDMTYLLLADEGLIENDWLKQTDEIDFFHPSIQELAKELRKETPKETAKAIAGYTHQNIDFDASNTYYDCYHNKASEILERGYGVCSTMSKLNIALLRANGIPAYSVTGCFKFNTACRLKQTLFGWKFPQFLPIEADEEGNVPTLGSLHNWVILPLYEDNQFEFIILESTTGTLWEDNCVNYRDYYTDPPESLACGLNIFDDNVGDCKEW